MHRLQGGNRGVSLLEVIVGLLILLGVILGTVSLFPTSYAGSMQAWRFNAATDLARQVLERQKHNPLAAPIGSQSVDWEYSVQGRPVVARFQYRVDLDSDSAANPRLWKVTVSWEHNGHTRDIYLVGAAPRT